MPTDDPRKDPEPKAPYGPQPKTTNLPAVTERALLEDLGRVVRNIADTVGETRSDMHKLTVKVDGADERLGRIEGRVAILESVPITIVPSIPPPPALTSTKVRALIDGTTSAIDLAHESQLAQERAAREALAKEVADLKATNAEQLDLLKTITSVLDKPMVKRIAYAAGALLLAALTAGTGYLARGNVQPAPPTVIQVPR
ncbi:MAG: hypothetical protein ABIR11_01045 [Candidatus Limnocylindrales bacterium]